MLATQVDVAPGAAALLPPAAAVAETDREARGEKEHVAAAAAAAAEGEEEGLPALPLPAHPCRAAGDVDGEAFPITSAATGERVYCSFGPPHARGALVETAARLERADAADSSPPSSSSSSSSSRRSRSSGLLSAPLSVLQDQAERDALERALAAAEDRDMQEAAKASVAARAAAAARMNADDGGERSRRPSSATPPPSLLWVDKYAPHTFMELLSDEQVNREVLRWVKSWHGVVFGGNGNGNGNSSFSFNNNASSTSGSSSNDDRPEHKILLLAGPPGLGKTTLAHVVARHCGYLPIEINASDERSATALQARVRDASELAAGGGLVPGRDGGRRPACVIVDEIDGAAGGPEGRSAVAALLRIVQATGGGGGRGKKKNQTASAVAPSRRIDNIGSGSDDSDREEGAATAAAASLKGKGGSKKGSSGPGRLLRPIIAICNDAFAPALRPLRSVALVVHVRPPATTRLISRLRAVCAAENVKADRRALVAVAEAAGRDVRSCLHALQLLAGRSLAASARARAEASAANAAAGEAGGSTTYRGSALPRVITHAAASSLRSGAKDAKQSAFDVWGALLHAGAPGPRVGGSVATRSEAAAAAASSASASSSRGRNAAHHQHRQHQQRQHRTASSLLWEAASDFGDADLLLRGLHESLPRLRLADGRAGRLAAATEALAAADAAATRGVTGSGSASGGGGGGGGDWALAAYAPLGLLRFRAAVAGPDRPRAAWPALFAGAERGRAANAAALSLWSRSLPAKLQASGTAACSSRALVSDVAPALLRIASAPGTRPVAHHLLSRTEKQSLEATVATLASYNLTYAPRTANDSSFSAFPSFGNKRDGFGGNSNGNGLLAVGGPAAAFAAAFAAAAESGAYGGSMMMMAAAASNQQRQPSMGLASASSLASAGSLASSASSSSSLPFGVGPAAATLKEGDLDLLPTVISDVVSFGLGRARPGASLPQPARALLASEVAQEVIRRREAAFAEKAGAEANAATGAGGATGRRVSSAGRGGGAAAAANAPAPLTLAERAAQSGAAARAALAAQQERERKGTWLDQIRGRASKRRAGVLAAAAARAAASVAATQERRMALAGGGGGGKEAPRKELSPGAAAQKAAAPKAVYRFNEGYTNAVRRPVRVRDML